MILSKVVELFFVHFWAIREAVVTLKKDTIISGRSIWSVRLLELQNLSSISDFINSAVKIYTKN